MTATPIKLTPDPLAPFRISPGFEVNGLLFLSGHAAISETGELVGIDNFDAQAEATFQSLQRTLEAGGSDLSKVVKVTIYLIAHVREISGQGHHLSHGHGLF